MLRSLLTANQKRRLKRTLTSIRKRYVHAFRRYDKEDLARAFGRVGVNSGDTVMMHANFPADGSFDGTPADVAKVLSDVVGPDGNLMMVSIPFRGSAYDYLGKNKEFDVRRTISMMGLVSEMFRRQPGTRRSLHPTHPVLAAGRDAEQLLAGHEDSVYPCGRGTPFEKLHLVNGKLIFVDVSFAAITFFHYLEDIYKDRIEVPVYEDKKFSISVRDETGTVRKIDTFAFRRNIVRDATMLENTLLKSRKIRRTKVGTTSLMLVECVDVAEAMSSLIENGSKPVRAARREGRD